MNMQTAVRRNARSQAHAPLPLRWVQWLVVAALVAWAVHLSWPSVAISDDRVDTSATTAAPSLVHWKNAANDWLLVVDQATHELVVYDANDGRPLRRLGATSGVGSIDSIRGEGNRLIVASHQHPRLQVLSLPNLQPATLAAR